MNKKEKNIIKEIENKITKDKILFFDLDGTLVETDYSNFLAYNKSVNSVLGENLSYNPNERFTREKLLSLFPNLAKKTIETIVKKKQIYYKDFLKETKLNRPVYNLLNKFYQTNRTFLVTNCRKNRAIMILQHYQMENKFEEAFYRKIINGRRINKFENAISNLAISPKTIVIFENEKSEISDAIDAGIPSENIIRITNL